MEKIYSHPHGKDVERIGGVMLSKRVRDRVEELLVLRFRLIDEELERSGVRDMPADSPEDWIRRAAEAIRAERRAEEKWLEVVEKEPEEVKVGLARVLAPIMGLLLLGHEE